MNGSKPPRDTVVAEFQQRFGEPPAFLVRAPGRVNLIGEHTDYNDGFVLPLAIERAVWIALRARDDSEVRVRSVDFSEGARFDAARPERGGGPAWGEYLKGTAWALAEAGFPVAGWEGVMAGDVPIGAGLSSSAALELATARAFAALSDGDWNGPVVARLAQRAENEWVGMNCGIMDQMISAVGVAGHAVLIDCRTLDATPVPLPTGTAIVILDTTTRRGLVDSAYNERRRQCEEAAAYFGVRALRDLTADVLELRLDELEEATGHRARHVVTENARTLAAAEAMTDGDAAALGDLMNESHASLRDDFEVSSEALDAIVEAARGSDGCYGARMTGAGFGGCGVALVERAAVGDFVRDVARAYQLRTGLEPKIYVTGASDGASAIAAEARGG
ncbi:MAG TPA: galactokinase [Longimicrobiales bacterium]|nr:galactokinase [Longimicrobiales bacterium]